MIIINIIDIILLLLNISIILYCSFNFLILYKHLLVNMYVYNLEYFLKFQIITLFSA